MSDLPKVVCRLESVASRLEALASKGASGAGESSFGGKCSLIHLCCLLSLSITTEGLQTFDEVSEIFEFDVFWHS